MLLFNSLDTSVFIISFFPILQMIRLLLIAGLIVWTNAAPPLRNQQEQAAQAAQQHDQQAQVFYQLVIDVNCSWMCVGIECD